MSVTLSWSTSADLDLYMTSSICNSYPPNGGSGCMILAASDNAFGTTERVTRTVASGESFKIWVDNFASTSQNYTLTTSIQ